MKRGRQRKNILSDTKFSFEKGHRPILTKKKCIFGISSASAIEVTAYVISFEHKVTLRRTVNGHISSYRACFIKFQPLGCQGLSTPRLLSQPCTQAEQRVVPGIEPTTSSCETLFVWTKPFNWCDILRCSVLGTTAPRLLQRCFCTWSQWSRWCFVHIRLKWNSKLQRPPSWSVSTRKLRHTIPVYRDRTTVIISEFRKLRQPFSNYNGQASRCQI